MILPPFSSGSVRRGSGNGDVRLSPRVQCSLSVGSPSSTSVAASCEWVKDDVLKYKSCLTSGSSVTALQCQVKLENPKDSCKLAV